MGIAAYNRGSDHLRETLSREQRPSIFFFMEELSQLKRYPDAGLPFAPCRIVQHGTLWWIQDAVKGDAGRGYAYESLWELCRRWQITLTAFDTTTGIYQAIPERKPECDTLDAFFYRHCG